MPTKVVIMGLGPIGAGVARQLLARRNFKVVAAVDIDAAKAGKDLAEVLGTGTLNLRRFSKRPNELLVLADLLDRRVRVEPPGVVGAVVDVAMECSRGGDWSRACRSWSPPR